MRYRCLFLDYDDTVVDSSKRIHYPSFLEALRILRPLQADMSFARFMQYCAEPGFASLLDDILQLNPQEKEIQQSIWKRYTTQITPPLFKGMDTLLRQFKQQGGLISAVSHSEKATIQRTYMTHLGFAPDMIFGWDDPPEKRKPSPYPIEQTCREYGLDKRECLVVDDLCSGMQMAKAAGVAFCHAGWSPCVHTMQQRMQNQSQYSFDAVESFARWLLQTP